MKEDKCTLTVWDYIVSGDILGMTQEERREYYKEEEFAHLALQDGLIYPVPGVMRLKKRQGEMRTEGTLRLVLSDRRRGTKIRRKCNSG